MIRVVWDQFDKRLWLWACDWISVGQ